MRRPPRGEIAAELNLWFQLRYDPQSPESCVCDSWSSSSIRDWWARRRGERGLKSSPSSQSALHLGQSLSWSVLLRQELKEAPGESREVPIWKPKIARVLTQHSCSLSTPTLFPILMSFNTFFLLSVNFLECYVCTYMYINICIYEILLWESLLWDFPIWLHVEPGSQAGVINCCLNWAINFPSLGIWGG